MSGSNASAGDRIFVRDFVVDCNVGVYAEEHGATQKVSFTVEAIVAPEVRAVHDQMTEVPSYTDIIDAIEAVAGQGHIKLVETFAERVAARILQDRRIVSVVIRMEKLERGPLRGIEIVRGR